MQCSSREEWPSGRIPRTVPYRAAYHNYKLLLIDWLGHATRSATYLSQASCVIVNGFKAALDLDTYPLSNLIRPRCAEQGKSGRGKPVMIMHNYFLLVFMLYIVLY